MVCLPVKAVDLCFVIINRFFRNKTNFCFGSSNLDLIYRVNKSLQSVSHVSLFVTPRAAARQASLSVTNSWSLLKFMFIELVMPSNHLILCVPFSSCLQSFPASGSILMSQFFTSGQSIGNFTFSISPSNEYSGLISFRFNWFDLLAVQGNLKSLL